MRFDSCHPVINLIYSCGRDRIGSGVRSPRFRRDRICVGIHVFGETEGRQGSCDGSVPDTADLRVYVALFVLQSFRSDVPGRKPHRQPYHSRGGGVRAADRSVGRSCGDAGVMPVCDIFSRQGRLSFRAHITKAVAVSLDNPEVPAETCEAGRQGGWRSGRCRKRAQAGSIVETRSELRANGFRAHHLVHGEHRGKRTVHEKPRLLAERPHGVFHIQIRQQRQELCRVHIPVRHADDDGCDAGSDPYLL